MTDLTNRVNILERDVDRHSIKLDTTATDVHDIKEQVKHIESDMSELKTITKNNASANLKTSESLNNLVIEVSGFKGGGRVIVWIISFFGITGLIGLITLINTLSGLNGS
jgi:hypothetical protein